MKKITPGYDLFPGSFVQARVSHCGDNPIRFPLPLIAFYDKTYTDLFGPLCFSLWLLWSAFFNYSCQYLINFVRVLGYVPNLSYGKGKANI